LQQRGAGLAGQHPVEHDEVGQLLQQRRLRVGAGDGDARQMAFVAQMKRDELGDGRLVLNDEYTSHGGFQVEKRAPCALGVS
jgi:hypothetical protein